MGGQACVFYGAAEFSRDTDLAVLADAANWRRLVSALEELKAECIAVPPCDLDYLLRGHALHFRCHHPEAQGMRVDLMSVMRGVDAFSVLWERRTTLTVPDGIAYVLLSLPDLVNAKKTQRSKDWPMIRRLVEADYLQNRASPDEAHLRFWLRELRTVELLLELSSSFPDLARRCASERTLLDKAIAADRDGLAVALEGEEKGERQADRIYWEPLKGELERLRHPR